jgi:hypothetical protein
MEWLRVSDQKPLEPDVVAVLCRGADKSTFRMTAYWTGMSWHVMGKIDGVQFIEISHWCDLPKEISDYSFGDRIG